MAVTLKDFRLLQNLGEGAAGVVYLATPTKALPYARPGDPLAIKVYKTDLINRAGQKRRMKQEFAVGKTLSHPHLVRMYDSRLEGGGDLFLVMEYVDGVTLSSWVTMFHRVPGPVVLRLFQQVCEALACLHAEGVQHRDLKPANIMVSNTIDARIMDLGVVRITSEELRKRTGEDDSTPTNQFLGTIRNAAPEMLLGEEYDERADLYSLGTVLYALLHGYEVFADEEQFVRLSRLVETEDAPIDEGLCNRDQICLSLSELLPELLAKDPALRPQTIEEVIDRLAPVVELAARAEPFQPLHGYVATALTGLSDDSGEAMAFLSSTIADVAKGYGVYVYQPRRFTDPLLHASVDPVIVYLTDRRRVSDTDVLFLVLNKPSFGVGQEIEIAAGYGRPVILLAREGTVISRMVTGSFSNIVDTITYASPEELERRLRKSLQAHIGVIRSAAAAYRLRGGFGLGSKISALRDSMGYKDPADLAAACHVSPLVIEALEQGRYENIGLELLARICRTLDVEVADILSSTPTRGLRADTDLAGMCVSLRTLESFARRTHLSAVDYFELRDDMKREVAARGGSFELSEEEWAARRGALEARNLKETSTPSASPQTNLFDTP